MSGSLLASWSLDFFISSLSSLGVLSLLSFTVLASLTWLVKVTNSTVWSSFFTSCQNQSNDWNLLFTCNQCKREIQLVLPSRSCSLHYFLECSVEVPAEATIEALIFVLQSVRQAPDQRPKHESHASLGWKLMVLNYSGHRNRLSYEQFSAFLANIKELNGHRQTREVWFLSSLF